ncbi:PKD domain-containing protein [Solitalea sp. MAHUQ-68]|uniref:PKD domain-containing protein n=2 Tax=Sphingobacteriaceae TaxID=84566 RepID=A0A9X2F1J0_9SPHI|nr:PKD domain-containing protein [Solitalea agri]
MLTAYTFAGCKETSTQIVTVSETPEADFTPEASFVCGSSARLTFTNTTKYNGSGSVSYKWFINDVLISTGKNLTNTFNTPSGGVKPYIFKVRLEASSPLGCTGKVTHDIQFNPLPQASFKENALLGCAPFNPVIENTSLFADSFEWYVNDVLVSTDRNPTNIVVQDPESEITVKMIAKNQWDCQPSEITRKFKTRPMPTVGFIMDESVSCNGMLKVNFSNQSSGASGYSWDFGDGSAFSTVNDPVHVFVKAGIYEVKLTADNGFCTATSVQYVKVADKPKAAFIADNRASCVSATVTFANQSINATKFIWDFGDGSFSGEKNPKHTYTSNKSAYNVKLTAIGEFGCQDEFTEIAYINVYPAPKADFEVKPDEVIKIPDYTFDFADKSEGEGLTYQWSFGDGKSSIEKDPKHTYTEVGTYSVRLIVKSSVGCLDTMVRNVTIEGVPGTLYVPNAFQPGSIRNELRSFMPKGVGLKEYRLRIFNTWGELIFETTRIEDGCPADGWDGSFNGKQLPQDVYIWDISAKFINGTEWEGMQYEKGAKKRTGTVHLIR